MTIVRPLVDGDAGTDEAGKRGPERLEVEIWSPIRLKLRLSVGFTPDNGAGRTQWLEGDVSDTCYFRNEKCNCKYSIPYPLA